MPIRAGPSPSRRGNCLKGLTQLGRRVQTVSLLPTEAAMKPLAERPQRTLKPKVKGQDTVPVRHSWQSSLLTVRKKKGKEKQGSSFGSATRQLNPARQLRGGTPLQPWSKQQRDTR